MVVDPEGLAFAVISSSAFIAWQRMVGGQIKSDLRFSNTLVWNTLPLPEVSEAERGKLIQAGAGVLEARALHLDVGGHDVVDACRGQRGRRSTPAGGMRSMVVVVIHPDLQGLTPGRL